MSKIIIIAGPTATGKDTLMGALLKHYEILKPLVSYTTRPMRVNEEQGKEYHFINDGKYDALEREDLIMSSRTYYTIENGKDAVWKYGAPFPQKDDIYITVVDHQGCHNIIRAIGRENVFVLYLEAEDETIYFRSKVRGDEKAETIRRLADDRKEFIGVSETLDFTIHTDQVAIEDILFKSRSLIKHSGFLKFAK